MKPLLLALLVGCAPQAMTTSSQHPANPDAPTGRLAGPPAALRPGVADVSTPARSTATPTPTDHSGHGADPADSKPAPAPAKTEPAKSEPPPTESAKSEPAKSKPAPNKPAPAKPPGKQDKPPASRKAPAPEAPKPTPPPAHQGHEGHH